VRRLPLVLAVLLAPVGARADAIVWSQAMLASTIAEFFVGEDRVVTELEIAAADLDAFQLLLPDELYERMGNPPQPWAKRLDVFFARVLPVAPVGGPPLRGRIVEMEPRPRVLRDPITGGPVPPSEDEEQESVVFVRIEYPLPIRPAALTFAAPPGASVGFVVYHEGIAVNDFRYLGPSQTLHLDWSDPWYSRFERRSLRRQYFAPLSGFLYVEPYEVRKEIIARPLDLQRWVDLGLEGRGTIPVDIQAELKRKAAAFLREHQPVVIDGAAIEPELARINFLERTLRTSRVIDPPRELDVHAAVLGAIFVYAVDGLPERVTMEWDLWDERLEQIPVASVDQAGPLPSFLESDWRVLEWRNFLQNPELPTLRVLERPPGAASRALLWSRWVLALLAALAVVRAARDRRAPAVAVATAALLLVAGGFWASRNAGLSEARARELIGGLLHNVYRAFDFRDEGRIYDVLAQSVDGDLLERLFLETRRGLELQSQGGARAKVKQVELVDLSIESTDGGAFSAAASWNVAGSVGHWGHVHERRNRYRAELGVASIDGSWKLVRVDVLEEERL
jgi:hypothetical protein